MLLLVEVPVELADGIDVIDEGLLGIDGEAGDVLPLVRITDLDVEGAELFKSSLLGLFAHPGLSLDALAEDGLQVVNEVEHHLLRLGREVLLDVHLTYSFAHKAIDTVHSTTPAWLLFLGTGEFLVVAEVLIDELIAGESAESTDGLPLIDGLEILEWGFHQDLASLGNGNWLAEVDLGGLIIAVVLEIGIPVEIAKLAGFIHCHLVVVAFGVAEFFHREANLSNLGLILHEVLHLGLCYFFGCAGELIDVNHVLLEGLTHLYDSRVVGEIVVAVAEAETTLAYTNDVDLGVLLVSTNADAEEKVIMLGSHHLEEFFAGLNGVHLVNIGLYSSEALIVEAHGVHGEVVEVSDLLGNSAFLVLLCGNALNEFCKLLGVVVTELGE